MKMPMKLVPIVLLLAVVGGPGALWGQDASAPPPIDPADTLKAVEMSAAAQPAVAPGYDVLEPVVEASYPPALRAAGVGGRVLVRMVVDAHGRAVAPRVVDSSGHAEIDAAALRVIEALRYTPARHGGAPHPVWTNFFILFRPPGRDWVEGVSADRVRAWADSAGALAPSRVDRAPNFSGGWGRVLEEAYPPALRDAGVRGTAEVWYVVDPRGAPTAIRLARSAGHPELDRAALRAIETLRFTPASRGGEAVAAWMTHQFDFHPPAFTANRLLPPGTYEMSPVEEMPALSNRGQVVRLIAQAYPPALRAQGVGGQVTVRMRVDERGVPGEIEVLESPHPELAAAAVRVAEGMRFRPARTEGKPVAVRITLPLSFQAPAPPAPSTPERP
jgi:TonB family protein